MRRGFNEAPALRGGKRGEVEGSGIVILVASMRPPHYAGENVHGVKQGSELIHALQ